MAGGAEKTLFQGNNLCIEGYPGTLLPDRGVFIGWKIPNVWHVKSARCKPHAGKDLQDGSSHNRKAERIPKARSPGREQRVSPATVPYYHNPSFRARITGGLCTTRSFFATDGNSGTTFIPEDGGKIRMGLYVIQENADITRSHSGIVSQEAPLFR